MERIIRGIIQIGSVPESEDCLKNWAKLREHSLEFNSIEDKSIFEYCETFYNQMSAPPDFTIIREFFEKADNIEVVTRLDEIKSVQPYIGTNYLSIVRSEEDRQQTKNLVILFRDASVIAEHGRNLDKPINGKRILKGVPDAVNYVYDKIHEFTRVEGGEKLEGVITDDAEELLSEYEFIEKMDKYSGRNLFGLEPVDSVCRGHRMGEYWIHTAFAGELKCVVGSSTIYDHSTKKRRFVEEIYESGDLPVVTALKHEGGEFKLVQAKVSHVVKNGVRPVFELILESGRRTTVTGNHGFFTLKNGWKKLEEIKEGDLIAVPKKMNVGFTNNSYSNEEARTLGYLVGNNSLSVDNDILFPSRSGIQKDFVRGLLSLNGTQKPREPGTDSQEMFQVIECLKKINSVIFTKRIPGEIFGLPEDQIASFIGAIWSTDIISCSDTNLVYKEIRSLEEKRQIKYYSVHKYLCLDVQSLLLRLGIRSIVKNTKMQFGSKRESVWTVQIVGNNSIKKFSELIKLSDATKQELIREQIQELEEFDNDPIPTWLVKPNLTATMPDGSKKYSSTLQNSHTISFDTAKHFVNAEPVSKLLFDTIYGDIFWEKVVSVKPCGEWMVYDLSVPEHHTFVVDDIVSHNTSLALNYAYNNSYVYGKNIFYSILEMPYKQLRRQLYVIHSSHGKFVTEWWQEDAKNGIPPENRYTGLDYRRVRDGELSPKDKIRLQKVAQDFKATSKGKLFVWRPTDEATIFDIKRKAEMFHNKYGCDGIVVDHLGLVKPKYRTSDYVTSQNAVVRDGRLMALNFARGRGVPVLGLFQMNRQGKLRADKNDGNYDMAAISYSNECIIKGTLVNTLEQGLLPIEEVVPGKHRVWSSTGWKDVMNNFNNGVQPVVEVCTTNGHSIKLTKSHVLRTIKNGKLDWIKTSELKLGDWLLEDFDSGQFPINSPKLPPLEIHKHEVSTYNGRVLSTPSVLNESLAYLMGAHAGDGIFVKSANIVGWCGNRLEETVKQKLSTLSENVFGQPFCISQCPSRPSVFDIRKQSKPLTRWFESVGMNRKPGVPNVVLQAPRNMVVAYIQGVMDTDGSINSQGIISIGLKESMKLTIQHLQILLLKFGINSTVYSKSTILKGKKFDSVTLRIRSRHSRELFARVIGFTEPKKQNKLMDFVRRYQFSMKAGDFTSWPVGDLLRKICLKYNLQYARKTNRIIKGEFKEVPHDALMKALNTLNDVDGDPDLDELKRLVSTTRPCRVESIEYAGYSEVYDLEVTGDHEYSTGGFFSHNCEKSADVITWTYLNESLRKEGKFFMGNLKNRDNPIFERMTGKILWLSKRMRAIEASSLVDLTSDKSIIMAGQHISKLTASDFLT